MGRRVRTRDLCLDEARTEWREEQRNNERIEQSAKRTNGTWKQQLNLPTIGNDNAVEWRNDQ